MSKCTLYNSELAVCLFVCLFVCLICLFVCCRVSKYIVRTEKLASLGHELFFFFLLKHLGVDIAYEVLCLTDHEGEHYGFLKETRERKRES